MPSKLHILKYLKITRLFSRESLTEVELVLWENLKNKKLGERKFRRKYRFGRYVVDFYCPSERLAVELHGDQPFAPDGIVQDNDRDNHLKMMNITVLRFENKEVLNNLARVLEDIKAQFIDFE